MAQMHTSQKKTHQYAHHTYQRVAAILEAVIAPEEIQQIGLRQPPLSEIRTHRQFRRCPTPTLAMESYSSDPDITPEEAEDTAACPHTATTSLTTDAPPS